MTNKKLKTKIHLLATLSFGLEFAPFWLVGGEGDRRKSEKIDKEL
jgi:hypothetical protein